MFATIGAIATKEKGLEVTLRALGRRGWTRSTTTLSHGMPAGGPVPGGRVRRGWTIFGKFNVFATRP